MYSMWWIIWTLDMSADNYFYIFSIIVEQMCLFLLLWMYILINEGFFNEYFFLVKKCLVVLLCMYILINVFFSNKSFF